MNLSASVGKNGKNLDLDVRLVQKALNNHSVAGGYSKLIVSGKVDEKTIAAIERFQKKVLGHPKPDGRVDAGGATSKALARVPTSLTPEPLSPVVGKSEGRLSGDTSGVQPDIVRFATEVAKFYGKVISISSGKRDAAGQGRAMFNNWVGNLRRGSIYTYLTSNKKLLDELDSLYKSAQEDKSKTQTEKNQAKADFIALCTEHAPKLSLHVAGKAIDVSPKTCMTPAMRKAMETGLRELVENSCYHYDTKSSAPQVTDALRKKWKPG